MKNTSLVPAVFLVHLLLWTALCLFLFSLGSSESIYALAFKDFSPVLQNALPLLYKSLFFASVFSIPSTFFYIMRHRTVLPVSILLVAGCGALCFFFLVPLSLRNNQDIDTSDERHLFSPALIRYGSTSERTVWLSQDELEGFPLAVIVADPSVSPENPSLRVYPAAAFDSSSGYLQSSEGALISDLGKKDVLVSLPTIPPQFLQALFRDMDVIYSDIQLAFESGRTVFVLAAGPFILSVFALFSLCFFSQWRLLNLMLCLAALRGLLYMWPFLAQTPYADVLRVWTIENWGVDRTYAVVYGGVSIVLLMMGIIRIIDRTFVHPEAAYE